MATKKRTKPTVSASPAEQKVYDIAANLFRTKKVPLSNGDIRKIHKGHRHTVKLHLHSLVKKGLIKRQGYRHWIPVKI